MRKALNSKATCRCITDREVLLDLKAQEEENLVKEKEKQERKLTREQKKKQKVKRDKASKAKTRSARTTKRGASKNKPMNALKEHLQKLSLSDSTSAECPMCGLIYGAGDDDSTWMQCDCCKLRRYLECAGVSDIPEFFSCTNCK